MWNADLVALIQKPYFKEVWPDHKQKMVELFSNGNNPCMILCLGSKSQKGEKLGSQKLIQETIPKQTLEAAIRNKLSNEVKAGSSLVPMWHGVQKPRGCHMTQGRGR